MSTGFVLMSLLNRYIYVYIYRYFSIWFGPRAPVCEVLVSSRWDAKMGARYAKTNAREDALFFYVQCHGRGRSKEVTELNLQWIYRSGTQDLPGPGYP